MSTKKPSATNAGEIAKVIENIVPKKIKVVCRCCHTIESKDDIETTKSDLMDLQEIYDCAGKCARQTACKFDTLLDKTSTEEQVFKQISPVVDGVLAGHNGSVVVFGQPGSGKTFTLEGDKDSAEEKGLIFRSIDKLYDDIKAAEATAAYVVSASYHEIFPDESTRDLLNLKQKTGSRPTELVGLSKAELMAAVNGGAVNHKRGQHNADVQPHTILRIKVQKTALVEPTHVTPVKSTASNKPAAKPAPTVPAAPSAPQDSNLFFVKLGSVNANTETREKELLKRHEFKSLLLLGVAVDSQRQFGKTMNLNSPLTTALKGSLGEDGGQAVLIACCNRGGDTKVSQPTEKASSLRSVEAKPPTDTHTLADFADLEARCRTGADDNAQLKLEIIRLQKAEKSEENELQDLKTALAAGKAISDTREETLLKATAELDELKIAGKKDAVRAAQYAEEIKVLKAELKELNLYMSQANRCIKHKAEKEEKHAQKQIDIEALLEEIRAKKDKLQSAVCEAAKKLQDVSVEKDKPLTELEGEKKCHGHGHEEKKEELPSNPHDLHPERDPCHQSTPRKADPTEEDGTKPDSPSDNHHLEHLEQHDCAAHNTYDLTVINFAPQQSPSPPAGSSAAGEGEPRTLCVYQRHATEDNLLRPVAWLVESDGITKHHPASYNGKTVVPAHTATRFKWQDTCAVFHEELSYFSKFGSFEFKPTEGEVVSRTVGANLSLQAGDDGEISLLLEGEGDPGKYRVKVGDLPSDNRVVLGVSTAGAPSAVVEVFPNMNYRLDADVEYYVAYDVFTKGVVIGDRGRSLNATRLHFPKHVKGHSTLTVKLHAHHTAK